MKSGNFAGLTVTLACCFYYVSNRLLLYLIYCSISFSSGSRSAISGPFLVLSLGGRIVIFSALIGLATEEAWDLSSERTSCWDD